VGAEAVAGSVVPSPMIIPASWIFFTLRQCSSKS